MAQRSKRVLMVIGALVILGVGYVWFFGFQTMMILEARDIAHRTPGVKLAPVPIKESSAANASGTTLSFFGYQFQVPWNDLDESKTRIHGNRVLLVFRSGKSLMFSSVPPGELVKSLTGKDLNRLEKIQGDDFMKSDYTMARTILEATPDKLTLLTSRGETVRLSMLLLLKSIMLPEESGIFVITAKGFHGFQYGDPEKEPRKIVADLFADDGGVELVFSRRTNSNTPFPSQQELNRVLQTIQKVPEVVASRATAATRNK